MLIEPKGTDVRRTSTWIVALLLTSILIFALAACSPDEPAADAKAENSAIVREAASTKPAGTVGAVPVDFNLKRVAGGNLQLHSLRGKAVIVDFWDTWCPPCRKALPHLQELSEAYGSDLVVVGVALGREGEAKVQAYIRDNGLTFEFVMMDAEAKVVKDFGNFQSIPTTFLLDRDGSIVQKWTGYNPKAEYENGIKKVIGS